MKKRRTAQSAFFYWRASLPLIIYAVAASTMVTGTLLAFFRSEAPTKTTHRAPTFAERVAYQRAIEEVYWRHRIWPKERPDPKPPLNAVMSQAQLEKKVADYLRKSHALEHYWRRPITPEQLHAEMDRMAKHTKQPEVLGELFEGLGNDPVVVAECLARPVLAERLVTNFAGPEEAPSTSWRARAENQIRKRVGATTATYTLPRISRSSGCIANTWTSTAAPPDGRLRPTAVWTGIEMIVWGGEAGFSFNTGGRYNPATDSWTRTSTSNAPLGRQGHTAVWTGTEMIVWGGTNDSTGGRYNPDTDSWTATSIANAPSPRYWSSAVWTGSEMIVWGGADFAGNTAFNTGGRYNPATDSWTPTNIANAPNPRYWSSAVWTGSEMIVWGGGDSSTTFDTGGKYDPAVDSWTVTSTTNVPTGRWHHTAIWTGSEMIVWGGTDSNYIQQYSTGGRYDPSTNSWTPTSTNNVPSARNYHTAVWTGSEMIVWGGILSSPTNTGGRYNPGTNTWTATSSTNAPVGRILHGAVWTGSEMIVWGGGGGNGSGTYFNTGGRYNPDNDSWTPTGTSNAPSARKEHTSVWTGSEMIVWGGDAYDTHPDAGERKWVQDSPPTPTPTPTPSATPIPSHGTGGRYDPTTDSWTATSTSDAPSARNQHTAVWTGSEMIVWGGFDSLSYLNSGGRYNPAANSWTATTTSNAPDARGVHTAVWTGSEMIVWGGTNPYNSFDTGGKYNPSTDIWTATSRSNVPTARHGHTAVWTGSEMIVWGGGFLNTGGKYNPTTDSWAATTTTNAPSGRNAHTAVWTGSEMIVWGGSTEPLSYENTGGRYNPISDNWVATSTTNAPSARRTHTAIWTDSEMIIWGGTNYPLGDLNTGGRYNPTTDSWTDTSTIEAPAGRLSHTAVWSGSEMIVWGGEVGSGAFASSGGRYCVESSPTPTPRLTPTPRPRPTPRSRP